MDTRDNELKKALGEFPLTYFVIRGNHEERVTNVMAEAPKSEWYMSIAFGNRVFVQSKYPYIKYAEDRALVYKFYDKNVLVIPGAYSVDKYYRVMRGWRWFPGEQMTSWEMEDCENDILNEQLNWKCDIVLSHTCPYHFEPTDLFIQGIDQNQVDKTMERFLGQIERKLDYKLWLWAHFHDFRHYELTDRDAFMLDAGHVIFDLIYPPFILYFYKKIWYNYYRKYERMDIL